MPFGINKISLRLYYLLAVMILTPTELYKKGGAAHLKSVLKKVLSVEPLNEDKL